MKTLKQILELYKPKSQDEDKFVKKHIVVKHRDKNGNGDDVFQATNIKALDRKKERHGYEPGEDEEVYEEVEALDEIGDTGRGQDLLALVAQRAKERKQFHKTQSLKVPEGSKEEGEHIKQQDRNYNTQQNAAARMDPRTRSQMGMKKIGEEYIEEKLKVSDGIGAWSWWSHWLRGRLYFYGSCCGCGCGCYSNDT
jgi:hypothetical protein